MATLPLQATMKIQSILWFLNWKLQHLFQIQAKRRRGINFSVYVLHNTICSSGLLFGVLCFHSKHTYTNKTTRRRPKSSTIKLNTCLQESTNLSQLRARYVAHIEAQLILKQTRANGNVRTKGPECKKENKIKQKTFMPFWMHRVKSYLLFFEHH